MWQQQQQQRPPAVAAAACGHYNLAFLGATTGDAGALGQNMVGGIKLALDEYNKAHSDCTVGLKVFDSQGDPAKATPLATQIVQDDLDHRPGRPRLLR